MNDEIFPEKYRRLLPHLQRDTTASWRAVLFDSKEKEKKAQESRRKGDSMATALPSDFNLALDKPRTLQDMRKKKIAAPESSRSVPLVKSISKSLTGKKDEIKPAKDLGTFRSFVEVIGVDGPKKKKDELTTEADQEKDRDKKCSMQDMALDRDPEDSDSPKASGDSLFDMNSPESLLDKQDLLTDIDGEEDEDPFFSI